MDTKPLLETVEIYLDLLRSAMTTAARFAGVSQNGLLPKTQADLVLLKRQIAEDKVTFEAAWERLSQAMTVYDNWRQIYQRDRTSFWEGVYAEVGHLYPEQAAEFYTRKYGGQS